MAHIYKNKAAAYLEIDHFSSMAQQPLVGQCHLINIETSPSHPDTLHSVGLSGRVITSTQRTLPDITLTKDRSMPPPVGFEPAIPTCERPQTQALHCTASKMDGDGVILHANGDMQVSVVHATLAKYCLPVKLPTRTYKHTTRLLGTQDKPLLRAFH